MARSKKSPRMLIHKSLPLTAAACLGMLFHQNWLTTSHGHVASHIPSPLLIRTYTTLADKYFQTYGKIPEPRIVHATLPTHNSNHQETTNHRNILVIGDVHGCFDELLKLHEAAMAENDGFPFQYVILVGDLCTKGPMSIEVIRHVRTTPLWLAVRGNNDDGALTAALGDMTRRQQHKYKWVSELSDLDVQWMAELPYTILIPGAFFPDKQEDDTLIVHAGLLPGVDLDNQTIKNMITIRKVQKTAQGYQVPNWGTSESPLHQWASVWNGPYRVIFGHDAPRGLQLHDNAIGLDTGACYGKKLTGMILPQRKLVQVDAMEAYCPI